MSENLPIKLPAAPAEVCINPKWIEKRDALLRRAVAVKQVDTADEFDEASAVSGQVGKHSTSLEKVRKEMAAPFLEAQRLIKQAADNAREPLESEKARIKELLSGYAQRQRQAQEEERRRLAEEQRQRELAAAEAAQVADDLGLDMEPQEAVEEVAPTVEAPHSASARVCELVEFTVTDPDRVPRAFMVVDEKAIRAWMRENQDRIKTQCKENPSWSAEVVDGIVFKVTTDVRGR